MPIKLGTQPIAWANDDLPELGGETTLDTILSEARQAGYAGIEKGGKFPNDPKLLKPIMDGHGLALVTGWFSGELRGRTIEDEKQRIRGHLELMLGMGCPVLVYAETTGTVQALLDTPVVDRPLMAGETMKRYGEKLTRFAEWLRAEGAPMAFHFHMGTSVEKESEVDVLMAHTGEAVGLLFDTGHLTFAGGDVAPTLRRHGKRVVHVHMKNIRKPVMERVHNERWSFLQGVIEGVFTVPGDPEGCVDFREVCRILKEIGYSGWMVVEAEQDPKKAHPLTYARMGIVELRAACAEAGLEVVG